MPPTLPQLGRLKLGGFELDLDYFLARDYDDISVVAEELPPIVEWVNSQLQSMVEQKIIADQEIKEAEARVYFDLRNGTFLEMYGSKMTEKALDRAVTLDEKVQRAHRDYAVLAGWVQRLNNLQQSLQTKLDLIRSSEATRRKIFQTNER